MSDLNEIELVLKPNAGEAVALYAETLRDGRSLDTDVVRRRVPLPSAGSPRAVTDPPMANVGSALEAGHKEIRMKIRAT